MSRHFQVISWTSNGVPSKSGTGFGYAQCAYALSEGAKLRYLLEDENNKGFLQKMPRAEHFGDLITADHKIASEASESRYNHRYVVVVQDLATQWLQSYPWKTKTFQETQKSLNEVPGADEETKSHLHWQFLGIWQVLWGNTVRRVKEGTLCGIVVIRSGWKMVGGFYGMLQLSAKHYSISCLMGRLHMKDDSECPLTVPWPCLEQ